MTSSSIRTASSNWKVKRVDLQVTAGLAFQTVRRSHQEPEHQGKPMVIGAVAALVGISAKTIRYYEDAGLVPRPARASNGYRLYSERAVHLLRFVKRARDLGFPMQDVGALLALWQNRRRASADVKKLARRHIEQVDQKISELEGLRRTLSRLTERCHGDGMPECPILDDIASVERR